MSKSLTSLKNKLKSEFTLSKLGLVSGIGAITLSSAYMNISGWAAMSASTDQLLANIGLSGGMELTALFALPYAGFMIRRKAYGKAALAFAIAAVAISTNIYATQNFLHFQTDTIVNAIELSGTELAQIDAQIAQYQQELESIIAQNGGTVPRDAETVTRSYGVLDEEKNPINTMRREAELGARTRYEQILNQVEALRAERAAPSIDANDVGRSVIPPQYMRYFVTALELMKATGLYILGNSTLFMSAKDQAKYAHRKKWAIIRKRGNAKKFV